MMTFTSIVYTIMLLILQRVSGDSVLNRKCYDLSNQTGIPCSAEIRKNLVKECFRDGIMHHSIDKQLHSIQPHTILAAPEICEEQLRRLLSLALGYEEKSNATQAS
eukprot:TRINITY_DN2634_c2_g3_i1.p8 TRINITY_DN2634_c2_g3~~TRINITY_DN2634_c2_g3_i1.p8  ORF type:complete len:106 (-),score=9.20 TRINITY_DN2634_c2_g3_i1:1231-1548(-)